jgi:F-type H+-transporting ATPase subunit b
MSPRMIKLAKLAGAASVALAALLVMSSASAQPAPGREPTPAQQQQVEQRLNRRLQGRPFRPGAATGDSDPAGHGGAAPAGNAGAAGHEGTAAPHEGAAGHEGAGHEGAAHEGGHEEGAEHAGHEEHHTLPFNFADFSNKEVTPYAALLINFAILATLYYMMGKKGVAEGLKKRKEGISKEIEEAQRMLKEAEERAKTYQAKLKNLESELTNAKKALEEAGKGERDRIVREAEEKAERMKRDANFLVDQELKQMRVDLTREAIELAMTSAEEMLRQKATVEDHNRLADDFLRDLDKAAPAGAGGAA